MPLLVPLEQRTFPQEVERLGLVTADGALLSTAFGLHDGGTFSAGRLLTGTAVVAFGSALADPAEPPVIFASSSSSVRMSCSVSVTVASEQVAGPEVGRGRSIGEALKILPTSLIAIESAWLDDGAGSRIQGQMVTSKKGIKPEAAHSSQQGRPGLFLRT